MPKSMMIAGGGVIGCEYACMFAALGIKVHLIEGRDRLLSFMDTELTDCLTRCIRAMDVELHLPDEIDDIDLGTNITIRLKSGKNFEVGAILAATGRTGRIGASHQTGSGKSQTHRHNDGGITLHRDHSSGLSRDGKCR